MTRFEDLSMPRSRPRLADHDATGQPIRMRNEIGPMCAHAHAPICRHPDVAARCEHPVEARVSSLIGGYTARCGDCGSYLDRHDDEWVVLRWRPGR